MIEHDAQTSATLDALRGSLDDVGMKTPPEQIITAGRRRGRRKLAGTAAALAVGGAAITGVALSQSAPAPSPGGVHIHTVAYTLDTQRDGSVRVTWDKQRYFEDHTGLQAALRQAGFPVLIREGEFCRGPQDPGTLDPSGVGPGVDQVMRGERAGNDKVNLIFTPAAMPPGKQLFIGYLTSAQLAGTGGRPGSVERLVPTDVPLTCTTQPPPGAPQKPVVSSNQHN